MHATADRDNSRVPSTALLLLRYIQTETSEVCLCMWHEGHQQSGGGSHMFSNRTVLSFSTMTTSDVPENAISMTLRPARWSKEPWFSFMSKRKMFPRLSAAAIRSPQVVNETAEKLPDIGRGMDKNNPVSTSGFGVLEVFHSCVVLLPPLSRLWSPLMDRFSR